MGLGTKKLVMVALFVAFSLFSPSAVYSAWETGTRIGYDSNVDHAIRDRDIESDSYLSVYLSFIKAPSGESRLNWALDASLLGNGYARFTDLGYGQASLSPALVYYPHRLWTISATPFIEGKIVGDSDQSAYAFGGKFTLRQQIMPTLYLTQYYRYKNSVANLNTYSYSENAVGISAGMNLSKKFYTELSYEYSRGDSFMAVGATSASLSTQGHAQGRRQGRGGKGIYSEAFNKAIDREMVDRHTAGILFGLDWSKSIYTTFGYNYISLKGESGSANSHLAELSLGYRF
jgi:hypothetical protein